MRERRAFVSRTDMQHIRQTDSHLLEILKLWFRREVEPEQSVQEEKTTVIIDCVCVYPC